LTRKNIKYTLTDIREIKDLIAAGNVATYKQIADSAIGTQKQITDLREEMRIGFTKLEGHQ
jgi:alkylated DNA nucleotide flippase Atl1